MWCDYKIKRMNYLLLNKFKNYILNIQVKQCGKFSYVTFILSLVLDILNRRYINREKLIFVQISKQKKMLVFKKLLPETFYSFKYSTV